VASVSAQSFERAMHHEATKRLSLTTGASAREFKGSSAPGEKPVDRFSDRGSIPLASTNQALDERLLFYGRLCRDGVVRMSK